MDSASSETPPELGSGGDTTTADLLRAVISVASHSAFSSAELVALVAPRQSTRASQIAAYNSCDGSRTQAEVVALHKLHKGSFSETVARWLDAGVLFRIRDGRRVHLLHLRRLVAGSARNIGSVEDD
jgi:hypothetical protein